ncbi:MAG: ATP-binding cassette domain-containing protein [Candidatus Pacebacteria bacterium]|nr:ATP-binding cassette domain-containing protein [Candidatus Paceibacterota bacterium]
MVEIGPKAGKLGGHIVFEGTPKELLKSKTLTGQYLSQKLKVEIPKDKKREVNTGKIMLKGCKKHNLKNINVEFPLNKLIGITGVSGSGKSTLIMDILYPAITKYFKIKSDNDISYKSISGVDNIDKCILIDQEPIGRTPRSNPVTYIGVFNYIRDLFTKTELSKMRGYTASRFSFNVKGGRCEACQGAGYKKIEMYFLPDVYTVCDECHGTRFNDETLEVTYKDKNISDVLKMSVEEALKFFKDIPVIKNKLQLLNDVGLGYMKLGQSSTTLSGGEAQRVKLAEELSKRDTGKTLYILDEPTTGLHFDDINKLLHILNLLVEKGNTVIVIEHELDIIKNCDYIIDMGPEGGDKGGEIIATGSIKDIKNSKKSYTSKFLKNEKRKSK